MAKLATEKCVPCRGDVSPLDQAGIDKLRQHVPAWDVVEVNDVLRLVRRFRFMNFAQALTFTNRIGEVAESENHHPALLTEWGKVTASWWTHSIGGLHRNDFVMAAKTDDVYEEFG